MTKLSAKLAAQVSEAALLEDQLEQSRAQVSQLRRAIEGNVLLVRRDGFSRPMHIHPIPSPYGGPFDASGCFPPYIESFEHTPYDFDNVIRNSATFDKASAYKRLRFRDTHRTDGFGRRIFEEI